MPFTLSHAVLAPPLSKITGNILPIAALAIGCMVPDLIRLFSHDQGGHNHLWRSMIHPNLWIGLSFCLVWYLLYRPVLYRFLGIQHDLGIQRVWSAIKFSLGVMVAIVVGTATHLIWDGLTHVDFRTFAFKDFLSQNMVLFGHTYPVHLIFQIGSSILALPFLLWMSMQYYRRHQQHFPVSPHVKTFAVILLFFTVIAGCFSAWDYARYFSATVWQSNLYFFTGKSINEFSQAALIVFSLGCLMFLFFDRDRRLG